MSDPSPVSGTDLKRHGLRYSSDTEPGIRRRRRGKGFTYTDAAGNRITDTAEIARCNALAVPPAYRDVWICADPRGHLQATGRDARGRKQYRYHPRWHAVRGEAKYHRILEFAEQLPALRRRVSYDLGRPGLPPEKVVAAIVRLLEGSLIRIGNTEYSRDNESYGLTTLRDEHVDVDGAEIHFEFVGKGGKDWKLDVKDPRVARVVAACQDLPGQHLFQYVDAAGTRHSIGSAEVNAYLHDHTGDDFTAKDFRTWAATVMAYHALCAAPEATTKKERQSHLKAAVAQVAGRLRNTQAICRKAYVHPAVITHWEAGALAAACASARDNADRAPEGLRKEEKQVWVFLKEAEDRSTAGPGGVRG